MNKLMQTVKMFLFQAPTKWDVVFWSVFAVLITLNPFYLNDRVNVFELGLYLPGINAIQHGLVPYRDFFHLRGPLELYVPAWLMSVTSPHLGVLSLYFYVGNVLCLVMVVLIAKEVMRTRLMLYVMIPVIIARTFPRVVFMFWGGMRYCMGLVAVYCLVRFFKTSQAKWIWGAGLSAGLAALISIEIGICAIVTAGAVFIVQAYLDKTRRSANLKSAVQFLGAFLAVFLVWLVYAQTHGALGAYLDATWTIVSRMQKVINLHLISVYPSHLLEALASMLNPFSVNFKHMTPAFLYVILLAYLFFAWRKGKWQVQHTVLLGIGVYGFIMYNTAFRGLWASQFEMALMPEKILYFFLIESVILTIWVNRARLTLFGYRLFIGALIIFTVGSLGYAFGRFNKRFWSMTYALKCLSGKETSSMKFKDKNETYAHLDLPRVKGIWVPQDQAEIFHGLNAFLKKHATKDDAVVFFPEMGMYHFLYDRPFVGRFPITTFSWFNDGWFNKYMDDLGKSKPMFLFMQEDLPKEWYQVYFGYPPNLQKYNQMRAWFSQNYIYLERVGNINIYKRR